MLKDLVKVASRLDSLGLSSEANFIDAVVRKFAGDLVQFPKEVWQDRPKMSAKEIREERKIQHERQLEEYKRQYEERLKMDEEDEENRPASKDLYPSLEEMMAEEEAYKADREENMLKRPYSSGTDMGSDMGSGRGRVKTIVDPFRTRDSGSLKSPSKKNRRGKPIDDFSDDFSDDADDMFDSDGNLIDIEEFEQGIGDEGFDQYENPETTYFRRSEPVGPGRGRSVYVPSDDANDMQRLAKRLSSIGLTKEARILYSIVKSANDDYLDEEEFSDDAWDDGSTEPYHYRDPRADEEEAARKAAMKKERERMAEEERIRINMDYYGDPRGNFAFDDHETGRPPNRNFLPPWTKADRAYKPSGA
jgi:hypothetical protein